jgi:uncharacterized protein (TIGR01244 family)
MSTDLKPFTDSVSFAGQPSSEDLKQWSESGVRSVVNLRPESEIERGLSPIDEKVVCSSLGMSYFHLPTGLDGIDEAYLKAAQETLDAADRPMVIHCAGGARAAILAAALHAMTEGTSGEAVVAMVEATGQSFNKELRQKVISLVGSIS